MRTWIALLIFACLASPLMAQVGPPLEPLPKLGDPALTAPIIPAKPAPIEVVIPLADPPPPPLWMKSVEFGINGTSGNSELFKLRLGGDTKREDAHSLLKMNLLYSYATANGLETENRMFFNGRYEWKFADSPYSPFAGAIVEYDEFRTYNIRLALNAGVSYLFIKDDFTLLKGRLGAGATREIGGPVQNDWRPEALIGGDYEYKISGKQKFTFTGDLFPDLLRAGEFRSQARVAYELLVDPTWGLTLKLGAIHRYDSTPQNGKPNDIEYFAVLLWKL